MAEITPGTGGTLKSVTAEAIAVEAIIYLRQQERDANKNPNGTNGVNWSITDSGTTFAGDFNLKAQQSISATGGLAIIAQPYLTGTSFLPGTGGTIKSTYPEAAVLECLMYLQALEADPSKNTNNRNFVTGTFNSDTGQYRGTFSLPVSAALGSDGELTITASEYLST